MNVIVSAMNGYHWLRYVIRESCQLHLNGVYSIERFQRNPKRQTEFQYVRLQRFVAECRLRIPREESKNTWQRHELFVSNLYANHRFHIAVVRQGIFGV